MPWVEKDVDKFKKGLTPKDKKKWVTIANSALQQCIDAGGQKLDCEVQAIKIANAKFDDKDLTDSDILRFKEESGNIKEKAKSSALNILLAEVATDEEANANEGYQMLLPVGRFYLSWYGEMIFTKSFVEAMVDNWKNKMLNEREPYIDTDHDMGEANGWIQDMKADDDGLWAKIE